ncbi:hypothetical protein SSBR45G_32450 [Bradyrhizobium sp. SSBR45G]|uniref:hypothetical protein n=1 Tax=unclassified Bradyrhizobium TaxID=2631580 RepID=UPI002342BB7C|nr:MULTISPECIES: hypothetical protein [unclassified Bradyrhizobium]GLH78336.1 hypothetical protein SSBR45G_32450 [Bradyrhizobium sp. SSBR45G]GLH86119.1 hypothetical protein SSBR45R_35790 [Bradyrhizobium sp. SSBR45R]
MALPTLISPRRPAPVFVCRKCLGRSDDAKGLKKAIKRATKHAVGLGGKPPRVIMTSCFGLCPKRAVIMTGGGAAAHGNYVLVCSTEDVADALALLREAQNGSS